jgi:hypothetical protein
MVKEAADTVQRLAVRNTRTLKMTDDVLCVRFSPDGKYIAVALLDSTIKVRTAFLSFLGDAALSRGYCGSSALQLLLPLLCFLHDLPVVLCFHLSKESSHVICNIACKKGCANCVPKCCAELRRCKEICPNATKERPVKCKESLPMSRHAPEIVVPSAESFAPF